MKSLLLILGLTLAGCMAEFGDYLIYNLEKGKVMEANVGNEMTYWTTITKGQFGDVKATFRQSLTYSGKQGSIVRFVYRERSTGYEGYARPALNQDLTYDIAIDSVITFRSTKIKVMEATNDAIKFIVLNSPAYQYNSGDRIGTDWALREDIEEAAR